MGDRKWRPWLLIKRNNLRAPRDAEETEFASRGLHALVRPAPKGGRQLPPRP